MLDTLSRYLFTRIEILYKLLPSVENLLNSASKPCIFNDQEMIIYYFKYYPYFPGENN